MDERRLKDSFAQVASHGDEVGLFFYSHLFLAHPELRELFPVSMSTQRNRLLNALGTIVSDAGNADALVPFLQELGRDHRKFGAIAGHYPAVGESLLATLAYFSGSAWTEDLAADWTAAYGLVSKVMADAAADADATSPAWWEANIIGHERRSIDVAVLRVAPSQPLPYRPGQSVSVECWHRPKLWRFYSMANAPRQDGTMDFHVRVVDGGAVSPALARNPGLGAYLRIGPPVGTFILRPDTGRDILMAAGGTGLAPIKAIIEQISMLPRQPRVQLFFGARTMKGLYDLPHLEKMAASWPWLSVTPVLSAPEHGYKGETGTVAEAIARYGTWQRHDAYVCGSSSMLAETVDRLKSLGTPPEQIYVEDFGWSET